MVYLETPFVLSFPSVDTITQEVLKLGRGCHIYKIDISRAFRHIKMDPKDVTLLGLKWGDQYYTDTCLPLGFRHGSTIFQKLSDLVHFMMQKDNYKVVKYIDDFIGISLPSCAQKSYQRLYSLLQALGLTISEKKLIPPGTKAVCLGILIDTTKLTMSIPPEMLHQVREPCLNWKLRATCTKRQLQSLLGNLLYIAKCVKPARVFLNRMLQLLRDTRDSKVINLTNDFHRDLGWFQKFLPMFNGTSFFKHRTIDGEMSLDACLTGLGGRWGSLVYHLKIPKVFILLGIVHLEMVNILVALRLWGKAWATKKITILCDNQAVVSVLNNGKTRDTYLAACARNISMLAAKFDIDINPVHTLGVNNGVADLLSRWQGTSIDNQSLLKMVTNPQWCGVNMSYMYVDFEL